MHAFVGVCECLCVYVCICESVCLSLCLTLCVCMCMISVCVWHRCVYVIGVCKASVVQPQWTHTSCYNPNTNKTSFHTTTVEQSQSQQNLTLHLTFRKITLQLLVCFRGDTKRYHCKMAKNKAVSDSSSSNVSLICYRCLTFHPK